MENPLLQQGILPTFTNIIPEEHIESALNHVLAENRAELKRLLAQTEFTWDNLMLPLEEMSDRFAKMWSPVSHLHSVKETDSLRTAYKVCLPLLTAYSTEFMQNETLFKAIHSLTLRDDYHTLNAQQRKVIQNDLRDFKLAGVNLPPAEKARFGEIQKELSALTTQFAENILDATQTFTFHVTNEVDLQGLPESNKTIAAQLAQSQGKEGFVLTLDYPCFSSVIKYAKNRELRRIMYEAYVTRASDQGPYAGRWDNSKNMESILKMRHELASLMGFANYAEYSLATKMADSPGRVLDFLYNLVDRSKSFAEKEMDELNDFAKNLDGTIQLEAWDIPFYTEKLRQDKYSVSQEDLKPYFPFTKVLTGLFMMVHKLYGLTIVEKTGVDVWHPQVQLFEIYDDEKQLRGYFYTDLFARPHKKDGAWMDECRIHRKCADGHIQLPVAFLTCNFTRPIDDQPALLSQDEVETLFHEFGHCLHHLSSRIDYASISGINGVPWDAVEFPSQIMEHWCWEKEVIEMISQHVETGETLPATLYQKLMAARNFQSGMQMLRQLEFSIFDFRIHLEYDTHLEGKIQSILNEVREQVAVLKTPAFNRFQHSFSHIFAGGYAAGYYSYKWAEVLSSDAFSLFEEQGIFNRHIGQAFIEKILSQGGLIDPMRAFSEFRGREPKIDALLRHSGLVPGESA